MLPVKADDMLMTLCCQFVCCYWFVCLLFTTAALRRNPRQASKLWDNEMILALTTEARSPQSHMVKLGTNLLQERGGEKL